MKKYLTGAGTLLLMIVAVAAPYAYAQTPTTMKGIVDLFSKAAKWMYSIFFVVAVIYILLAAFVYLRAGDDAPKVQKATTMLKNAVIAIVIALLSAGVALIINNFLTQ
jgi:Type IV secretion system pilin